MYGSYHSNCARLEEGALGRTPHQRTTGTVPALRRHHEIGKPAPVVEATVRLGYPESVIVPLGFVLLVCTVLYLIPLTSVLGAILLTGYLGGAVATHVRAGEGLFSLVFPIIFGVLIWLGLYLRDDRLRALVPLRR